MSRAVSPDRRRFLKTTVATGAAAAIAPVVIPSSALGRDGTVAPSERIVVGGIGIGNRGTYDLSCFLEQSDVQFVAVCDVKEARRKSVKAMADKHHGNSDCKTYIDYREILDRKDIDSVLIATGPNWHATMAMYAARAGKDIYCEKPVTKNISQSLILAETMRRTGRVFQAGTQRRNLPHFAFACELARTGKLGKLKRVFAHPAGLKSMMSGWMDPQPEPPKETVDWDTYLGPAPGDHSIKSTWMVSTLKKVADWSAVVCSNGDPIASISVSGQWVPMAKLPSNTTRSKMNNCEPCMPMVSS